jgi:16S rRNA processing protein RimM
MPSAHRVVLGEVVGAHGTRGALRVLVLGDGPENLLRAPALALVDPEAGAEDPAARDREVVAARPGRTGEVRLELRGIESREAAQAARGLLVAAETRHLAPLPSGEHYWFELVGCTVESHDGRRLGTVRALLATGAHDVLVLEDERGGELLLPAAAELLKEVDVEVKRIVIEVPEGLLDPS